MITGQLQQTDEVKPLLTIAIPTYNRARYLGELLSVLFDQLVSEPRVELIISDNASPDETPALIKEYQHRGLKLRYIRNETNVGADANFLQCFEQARGKYVWIFGDDDIIIPGGVAKITSYLDLKEYDLVYINSFALEDSYKAQVLNAGHNAFETENARVFVSHVHIFFTFISGNIINKETVLSQRPEPLAILLGSNLVQLGWTYTALNGFRRGLHIEEKLIGARINNTGGYKLLETFGPTLVRVTNNWLQSERLRQIIVNGTIQRFWPGISVQYKSSAASFQREDRPNDVLAGVFKSNPRYWSFVYPILLLPPAFAAMWLLLVRVVNRIDRAFGFVMLRC